MKYMMLVYLDEQAMSDSEREHCYVESAQLTQQLNSSGQYLDASPLHPVSTATSVRVRDGKRLVTDGPFAETREQLGGYYLIDASGSRRGDPHRRKDSTRPIRYHRNQASDGNLRPPAGLRFPSQSCLMPSALTSATAVRLRYPCS